MSKQLMILCGWLFFVFMIMSGCAKDPQVWVTPFALKPETAQVQPSPEASSELQPARQPYEQDMISQVENK